MGLKVLDWKQHLHSNLYKIFKTSFVHINELRKTDGYLVERRSKGPQATSGAAATRDNAFSIMENV